jgi:hypothetical protein
MNPITLAQAIPVRFRQAAYSILATAVGLEVVLDLIPAGVESKIIGVLIVLGFGTALANTGTPPLAPKPEVVEVP